MRLSLTKRCEYGIRMMLQLALMPSGTRLTAAELATLCDVPAGNVPTIVNNLSRSGLLICSPGRGGGCMLSRDPSRTPMLQIIEALEGSLEIDHCLLDSRVCHDHDPECALHEVWVKGRNAALKALQQTTLADAAKREKELRAEAAKSGHKRRTA